MIKTETILRVEEIACKRTAAHEAGHLVVWMYFLNRLFSHRPSSLYATLKLNGSGRCKIVYNKSEIKVSNEKFIYFSNIVTLAGSLYRLKYLDEKYRYINDTPSRAIMGGGWDDLRKLRACGVKGIELRWMELYLDVLWKKPQIREIHEKLVKHLIKSKHIDTKKVLDMIEEYKMFDIEEVTVKDILLHVLTKPFKK